MVRETRYLIVRNLPENCTEEKVIDHFQRYGKIQSVKLQAAKDNDSGGSTATVAFNDIKSAAKAHHAKNNLGEVILRTDYWEGSTGTPVIATTPVATPVRPNYTPAPLSTFPTRKKGPEEEPSSNQDKAVSTPVQVPGVNTPVIASSALEKLTTTPSFDHASRGRTRDRITKKKFGKLEKNGSFGRPGTSTRSLEAVRSQSEAAVAAATALAVSSNNLASTSSVAGSGTNGSSGTSGLNPIIVNDSKDFNNKEPKENVSKSAASPSSRNSGFKKSQSQSRSASRSRSRSPGSKSSSSRSDSSGTSSTTSPHKSSSARPLSMVVTKSVISDKEPKRNDIDGEKRSLGICVTGLPLRSTDSSLKDGLFHEYKKHGKVTSVLICLEGDTRYAIVSFKKPEDASKALEASQGKVFFGAKIKVTSHEGVEVDEEDVGNNLDEYDLKSTRTLFVGNLEKDTTKEDLLENFKKFGEIIDVDIKRQGATTAFAFVQYVDITSVVAALKAMEGEHIGINKIKLGFGKSMPTYCVWVDNLPTDLTNRTLKSAMARYGDISYCLIDKNRNRGLIYFTSYDDAQHCVNDIKMRPHFMKKRLQVDFASRECQNNFLDRMEESGQLRANERPDEARSHDKFRQRSFENVTEEGSPSSSFYGRTSSSYRRRGRQYDSNYPEESHQTTRRSRRTEEFSSQSSVYYSGKGSSDDYVAELREYEYSKRERRDKDVSPRHSSADRRVDSQSRRGSRDPSLDRYEDRQKERSGGLFNSREISPGSEHNSFHSENRYRSSRDEKYVNRDRYEDGKMDDKDFDRHSRPSRTTSPFPQNHTSLHSHDSDVRRVGSRSQSPTTPLHEDTPRFYLDENYKRLDDENDYYPRRRDSDDFNKSKSWQASTKLGAEVIKTVERRKKRTHDQSGLSDLLKSETKLLRKQEKTPSLVEIKPKNLHRQLITPTRRSQKVSEHPSSPGSSGSHVDSENGSLSEGDLHHLHQEKQHILKELKECEAEVVDASEPDSPRSVARVNSVAVKDISKLFGRTQDEKRAEDVSFRRLDDKTRHSNSKSWNHISDDLSSTREDKHLLIEKDDSIGDNSDSDLELHILTKKKRTKSSSEEENLDRCSEQNLRISVLDRRASCDSKANSLKFLDNSKATDVSSSCDNGHLFNVGFSDKDSSVIKNCRTSSVSYPYLKAERMPLPPLDSSPHGYFSSAYSEENTEDSLSSGSLSGKHFKRSPPGSPLGKDSSDSEFSYSKFPITDVNIDDSFSDDSLSDNPHAPNDKEVEERLRCIDEILNGTTNKTSDLTLSSSFANERLRNSVLGGGGSLLSEKKQEPSVIMKQVLAKKSILDQDIIRLRCNNKIDQPAEISFSTASLKSLDISGMKFLPSLSSLSHPVTTSSSSLQPTITTSVASSTSLTSPISTSVLTSSIVSAPISSSNNISPKTAAVNNAPLSRLSESSTKQGFLSEKLQHSTNWTLESEVPLTSVCSNSLSSKSVLNSLVQCSPVDSIVDNLLISPSVAKSTASTSLPPSLSSQQSLTSLLSSPTSLPSITSSLHVKNTMPQIISSSLPVTSSISSMLSSVTKSPIGATVAAPFTQGPDKSQLTPTVGQEAPHLCSPSFTPEISRTSTNSHLPGSRGSRVTPHKQKDDQYIPCNKHELTVHISKSEDDSKSQASTTKTEVLTPDIESPVSVKSETSSNSSVPLSSLDNKANSVLEDKMASKSQPVAIKSSGSENNNVLLLKSPLASADSSSSIFNAIEKSNHLDVMDAQSIISNVKTCDVSEWSSKKPEIFPSISSQVVFGVSSKDKEKELPSPSESTSKGKPTTATVNIDAVTKPLSSAPSTSTSLTSSRPAAEKTDKKPIKSSSHSHSKSPAKSEALFAPDVKPKSSEKTETKHQGKDSHKQSSSNKSTASSSGDKKVSKTASKDSTEAKVSGGSKEQDKTDKKSESIHKNSGHETSKTKDFDKNKCKDKKDNSKESERSKQKEESKKKEEKKAALELKIVGTKEDKKTEKKIDDKKEKEKEKSKDNNKLNLFKKSKPENVELNKKDKKLKAKESSSKEKIGEKKLLPSLSCVSKHSSPDIKPKEVPKSETKLLKAENLKSSEFVKNEERTKADSKHKSDSKVVSKTESKAESLAMSKKPAAEPSKSKKEIERDSSKLANLKVKQKEDKVKEKQKLKDDRDKLKDDKDKLKDEKEKFKDEKEKLKEEKEKLKDDKEKLKDDKERSKDDKEKQKEEKEEKDEKEKQKDKKELRDKEEKERLRKEKEEKDRQKEREEREKREKEEKLKKEKEEKERQKEREEREAQKEKERLEREKLEKERKEKEERERQREREEKEKQKEREEKERKEREKEEKDRKEKEEKERKEKEEKERKEKEREERERKEREKEEKERKEREREERERQKEKDEKLKEKEKEEKERKEKEKEEREKKEKEKKEKERREKKEKERKAKEDKLRREREEKAKKEKEEKAKKEREDKAKKEGKEKAKKEKKEKDKKEKDDDDKDDKDLKKPPPKKPKRNELAVLLDSNDKFQMTFTSMYDRVKTQRNREPEQHKPEPAPKSSFDKFKQNRKQKGNKAKSSLYSCGSNSDLSDDSDMSESESSQNAESIKESKPKKTGQVKKRPHVSSSSSSSCEEDDDALLKATKSKGKKPEKFNHIFSSDSEEDHFPPPKSSSKSKTKPIPKRRKTREDSTDSINSREEFIKPIAKNVAEHDSLDDVSDDEDKPKMPLKKKTNAVKKSEKSTEGEKRDSSVESITQKVTKVDHESSVESVSKKFHKSDKEETQTKKLKAENRAGKADHSTERKSSAKSDVKVSSEIKTKVKDSSKDKKERETKHELEIKPESKKDLEGKKDSQVKKETKKEEKLEVKKDETKKESDVEKSKIKDKYSDDLNSKHTEERKKKKEKEDGPVKKKKKKKLDPKAEEESVNSLINKVYDASKFDRERKQKKRPKPSLFDSDSDLATSETSVEIIKPDTTEEKVLPKLDIDTVKTKEKNRESSKDKEILKDKPETSEKSSKHGKDTKFSTDAFKKVEPKKKDTVDKEIEIHKKDIKNEIIAERKSQNSLDETSAKPPKKKKKKKEHDKEGEKVKSSKVKKGEEKAESDKKGSDPEKNSETSTGQQSQVVDEFVSFWGHPKPILIPKRLKDTPKADDDKKHKEKDDGKTEDKPEANLSSKDGALKEEKSEKLEEPHSTEKTVKIEPETEETIVPISEAETTITTEQVQTGPTSSSLSILHADTCPPHEDVTAVKDETTIGSSVEIQEDEEYPSLVIDEVSETVSDDKKKLTKKEKKFLKQQLEEKERNSRMDEVIASVANAGSVAEDDLLTKEKGSPSSLQIDSVSNDRELDLSDVINLKCEHKFSSETEHKSMIDSDLIFPDDKKKSTETALPFSAFRKDKKETKSMPATNKDAEQDAGQKLPTPSKNNDIKTEDGLSNVILSKESVVEKEPLTEEHKPTEEEIKKKQAEELKKQQEEEEERKAEEERKKIEEEKARQEKEQQAIREASDEAARAVESLLEFQSGFDQDSADMEDDLPPLFIEPAEEEPPSEVTLSPSKDKIESEAFFTNAIPEKLTANLDDKLLEETKLLVKGDQSDSKVDALSFFTPPQAIIPGFTSPRRNSVVQDRAPEPSIPIPSPQRQMQSPQRQIPQSPQIQSPQIQSPQCQMPSPQKHMPLSPQRQLTSPQRIQSPQRPLQSPLRPLQSPQISLQSPLQSPPFISKDSKMDRSIMSPNREILMMQELEPSSIQQNQRRTSAGIPIATPEQAVDSLRRKSQEFPMEPTFHSPRRNTICVPEEAATTHLDHRVPHHGASVIYSKKSPHGQSSLPPPVSISLDNAPHDKNFQTPMRNINIPPHQDCNLLSPKKISPNIHFTDLPADPTIYHPASNKTTLQDSLFPTPKPLFNESLFSHHQKHPTPEQMFHHNKPLIQDILKTSGIPDQHIFFTTKGAVAEKPIIAKLPESNFPFSKTTLQEQLFTQVKVPQHPLDNRLPQEPLFSSKSQLESTPYNYGEPVDFLSSPPRNSGEFIYTPTPDVQKLISIKQGESHDLFNKDPFHTVESRLNERVDPMQQRRLEGFPASYYQEPIPAPGNLSKFPDNIQQSAFDEEKKNARKRKRMSKRSTKEDKAAALAEQQAIEQSVQANVESIHKALTASQAKAAAEKAGSATAEKKKSVDAYDFEAYTGQELGSQNISGTDNTNFSEDLRQTRSRYDRGRRRGCVVRRGKNGRGGFTSVVDSQDSLQHQEPFAIQQPPSLSQQTPFTVPNQDQMTTQSHPKHAYIPFPFSSQQQQQPSFQRQNSQPVTQSFYTSPQSSSDNNSSMSTPEWQIKQTSLPHQQSQTLQLIPQQQQHLSQHQQLTQQQQVKLPVIKPDDRSPETNKQDLDSSYGESELVINLDDQPSSIEGKENQNSFSSDGDTPSPATPKAQRSTRFRKQPNPNYKAIPSGTIPAPPQPRSSRSGGSPRGRSTGAQSPKNNMSPRASSCENVQSSPVVKLEKLEVTRTTRRRKGLGKDENLEDIPSASFEDWKAKKCDEKKTVSKENIYEFVDNEQEQSLEPNLRTRARKKRASENQEQAQSQQGVDYLMGSPPTTSNSSFIPDTKGAYESLAYEPRTTDEVPIPKQVPLSNVDAVIDAVSKGIFGSNEDDHGQDIPTPVLNEQADTPSPIPAPPTTRLTRRSTEAKKEAEQKEIKFTIEPAKSDSRDAGKKGPTVPPLRIKVAHGTPKVEKKEEKHYVIERANKIVGSASEHNEKPPLAFTVKLSDSGTATIKPAGSGNGGNFNSSVSLITKNTSQDGIGMKYGDSNLKKENHLGLFSGLPQNEQQQPSLEHEINKSIPSQVTSWKPVDSVAMDSPITRPSGTLHPKLAAKVQASHESMNNASSSVSLVMQNTQSQTSQPNLPPPTSTMSNQSKPSVSPIHSNNMWNSNIQGNNLNQSPANSHLPLQLQNLSKDSLMLQRPPSAHDLLNKQPPSAHIQPALRNERNMKGPKIDVNQEMVSKINPETSQKHPEAPFGFSGPVPPAHLGQRSYMISPDQQGIHTSHTLHFPNNAFKTSLEMRNPKSPSIPPQTSLKLGSDMGTRTPPVNPGSMLYAGIVSAQPISLSPTTASPEGQVIERLPNPLRVQGESGCQSPLSLRMHPDQARFIKDDLLESSVPPSVRGDQNMMFLLEQQRLRQHLLLMQENNRTSNQEQNRNAEVPRNMIMAHEQSRNTPVGLDSVRKTALAPQPAKLNQPLNLADSDSRGESSRVTPKSTPPAPQSPFSLPYLDRKVEPGRMQVGVTSAFMQPSPSAAREALSHMYQDLPLGLTSQFGMVNRISLDPHMYGPGHQPQAHLLREGVLPSHFSTFSTGPRFPGLEYSDKKGETGHPDQVSSRGMLSSPSPNPMLSRQADMLLMKPQQLARMPSDLPTNSPVGILQRYPVMWQGALALKNDNSYVQMHFIAGNRRLPNQALPQPMQNGALPPLRISQRMRLEQAQLEGVSKRMQCEDDYCILIAVACGRDQADISTQTRALNEGFINYLLNKQAAGIVNVPLPGSEQAGFVVHIFPPCEFVDSSVAEQGSMALMEQLRDVPHAVIIIATT